MIKTPLLAEDFCWGVELGYPICIVGSLFPFQNTLWTALFAVSCYFSETDF